MSASDSPSEPGRGPSEPGRAPGNAGATVPRASVERMADGEWHRLHPATPLLRGGIGLLAVLGIVFANLRQRLTDMFMSLFGARSEFTPDESGDPVDEIVKHGLVGWVLLAIAVVLLLALGLFYLSWRMHTFRIGDDAVEVRNGVLSRRHRKARLDRIQGVNLSKPLFARLFGTAKLEVSVAGHDANVELAYLGTALATALRRDILLRASGARRQETPADPGRDPANTNADVMIDGVPQAVARTDATVTWQSKGAEILGRRVNDFASPHYDPDAPEPTSAVSIPAGRLIGSIVVSGTTITLIIVIAAVVAGTAAGRYWVLIALLPGILAWGSVYVRRFTKSMNYSIVGTADGVRVGFGLLSTSNETIPPGRIHAIEVMQPLIWRPFGWWQIRIDTAGRSRQKGAAGQPNTTILPVGDAEGVERVLALVLPTLADERNVALVTAGMSETGAQALAGAGGEARLEREHGTQDAPVTTGFSVAPRSAVWLRPFSWRRTGYILSGGAVLLRSGAVWRRLVVVPLARLQSLELQQGPVRRRLGLAKARLHTVDGPVTGSLPVVGDAEAVRFFDLVAGAAIEAAAQDHTDRWGAVGETEADRTAGAVGATDRVAGPSADPEEQTS